MSEDYDPWALSSGLPLDGATVTVASMEFGYRQNIAAQTVFACFGFRPDEGEDAEQCFSVGKGWEPGGKGASLVRSNGRRGNINDQTGYGKFIAAALKLPGVREELIARKGDPTVAATWNGMRFVLGTVRETTTNPTTNQQKEVSRIIPVEFLGTGDGEKVKVVSANTAKPTAPAVDGEIEGKLLELAAAHTEHDDFMAAAYEVDGVAGNAAVESLVMSTGKGSIWARAKAA